MEFNANQLRADALLKEGRYKYTVVDASEKKTQAGDDMLNLKLALEVESRRVIFFDRLVLMPKMFWKLEHFCKSAGIYDKVEKGSLSAMDCAGKTGYVDIIQKANNQTGELENQVKDYVKPEDKEAQEMFDGDIPQ